MRGDCGATKLGVPPRRSASKRLRRLGARWGLEHESEWSGALMPNVVTT